MRSTSNFITIVLLSCGLVHVIISSTVECQQQAHVSTSNGNQKAPKGNTDSDGRQPSEHHDYGLFSIDYYYNETKFKEKLRVSKSFFKMVVNEKFISSGSPISQMKISHLDELLRCNNLTWESSGVEHSIDCKPLGEQILGEPLFADEYKSKPATDKYVKRSSVRVKHKMPFIDDSLKGRMTRRDYLFYPLRQDVIQQNIQTLMTNNDFNDGLGFGANEEQLGFYFEFDSDRHIRNVGLQSFDWLQFLSAKCSGYLIMSINGSSIDNLADSSSSFPENYPQFARELDRIFADAMDNGFLLSFRDVKCGFPDSMLPISVHQDFTLIKRNKFPYITCNHNMGLEPMGSLWKYEAFVKQTRQPTDFNKPDTYNTTISITSLSSILDMLKFKLDQTFAYQDNHKGHEVMTLVHPYMSALVQGEWSIDSLVKSLKLFMMDAETNDFSISDGSIKPFTVVSYDNTPDSDYVKYTLKVLKKSFDSGKVKDNDSYFARLEL